MQIVSQIMEINDTGSQQLILRQVQGKLDSIWQPTAPSLIIFDKDGTLIDFDVMWGGWLSELARRLEQASGQPVSEPLFALMEYDPHNGRIDPQGRLAIAPMAELWDETLALLQDRGFDQATAEIILTDTWQPPDPVALARPLADLPALFTRLRRQGLKIAVATSDDRAPTVATLAGLGLDALVDAVVAADDGLPGKPAPDAILHLCHSLEIPPAETIMVGDTVADLEMARAAGAQAAVGVLSGVSTAALLEPYADLIIQSVADLIERCEA